jgi:hypothetical protein
MIEGVDFEGQIANWEGTRPPHLFVSSCFLLDSALLFDVLYGGTVRGTSAVLMSPLDAEMFLRFPAISLIIKLGFSPCFLHTARSRINAVEEARMPPRRSGRAKDPPHLSRQPNQIHHRFYFLNH